MRDALKGVLKYLKWLFGGYDVEIGVPTKPYMYDRCHLCGAVRPLVHLDAVEGPSGTIIGFVCGKDVGHAFSHE